MLGNVCEVVLFEIRSGEGRPPWDGGIAAET